MIAAKNALQNGVTRIEAGEQRGVDFVLACVDYLDFIISRFVEQGRGNAARLREVVPEDDAEDRRTLADIENTLARTGDELAALNTAARRFRADGSDFKGLTDACDKFLGFYNSVLARRKDPAQAIIQKHIDADRYWQQTNDVTADSIETEQALFAKIRQLAPDGLRID